MENTIHGKADGLFDQTKHSGQLAPSHATMIELRQDLDRVIADWNELVSQAAARSVIIANETVRSRPWTSVAIAAALGALLAVALTSQRRPPAVARATPAESPIAQRAPSRPWMVDTQPLTSRLSQTWDSIAALNANALPALPSMDVLTNFVKAMLPAKAGS
jgi:DUF883 C-terminal glycine zipper region